MGITPEGLWTGQPWLQFYWVALFMKVFGDSIFFLRLPFVIAFLGSIFLMHAMAKRLGWDNKHAGISMVLFATSVPLIIASRNVRYYSLLPFFALGLCVLYYDLKQGRARRWMGFGLVSALFMHTMQPVAAAVIGAILLHAIFVERDRKVIFLLLKSQVLMLALFLPWLIYVWPGLVEFYRQRATSTLGRNLTLGSFLFGTGFYLITLTQGSFPLILTPFLYFRRQNIGKILGRKDALLFLLLVFLICAMMSFIFNSNLYPGYVLAAVPFLILLGTAVIVGVSRGKNAVAFGLTFIVATCTILNLPPLPAPVFEGRRSDPHWKMKVGILGNLLLHQPLEFPLFYYFGELANNYVGPVETLVEYLGKNAAPTDTFFASNDGHSIHFATGLARVNEVPFPTAPTWIIRRGNYPLSRNICKIDTGVENADAYIDDFIATHDYEATTLNVMNIYHENVPVLPFHNFIMPQSSRPEDQLVVLRLKTH